MSGENENKEMALAEEESPSEPPAEEGCAVKETLNEECELAKKFRPKYFFEAVISLVGIYLYVSSLRVFFYVWAVVEYFNNDKVGSIVGRYQRLWACYGPKIANYWTIVYYIIGFAIFGTLFYRCVVKNQPKIKLRSIIGAKSVTAVVTIGIAMHLITLVTTSSFSLLLPECLESYRNSVKSSIQLLLPVVVVIESVILAPLFEEIYWRGLFFGLLEKSGIKPLWIILLSGILFGVLHGNPVQGVFAAIGGCLLSFLRYKYRSVKVTIIVHSIANLLPFIVDLRINLVEYYVLLFFLVPFLVLIAVFTVCVDDNAYTAPKKI